MNKALVLLTLALAFGIALAPTAAAACPPTTVGPACSLIPVTSGVDCLSARAGDIVDQVLTDCI